MRSVASSAEICDASFSRAWRGPLAIGVLAITGGADVVDNCAAAVKETRRTTRGKMSEISGMEELFSHVV